MDEALLSHQRQLDAVGERIGELERRGNPRAADRLRAVHERVSGAFAELRRAYADDWRRIQDDAHAGWRELMDELGTVDSTMLGFHDEQIETLDRSLDELTRQLEALHADDVASIERRSAVDAAGIAELRAQVAEARKRRQAIGASAPTERGAAVAAYSAAVNDAVERWRQRS
jgi:hypothetical protein